MIPGAEASKAVIMITDGPAEPAEFTRNWENSSASPLKSMVSMTGYWNAYKLDIPMAMAMVMMSSERHPPSIPPSQDETHTIIGDLTELTVSDSDNDLHLVRVTSVRLDSRMPDIQEVEIWRMVSLWMFLLSLLISSLYIFTSLDLGPVQTASARVFTTSGDKSSAGGVSPCTGSAEWLPYGTDRLWDLCVRTFAYVEQLFNCFHPFLLLYGIMQPRGSAPNEGDNVMAWLHVTYPGPGNTRFI